MPFVKFSYPVGGREVGKPVHVDEATADRYIRDGVATKAEAPKVEAKPKAKPKEEPRPGPKPSEKKPTDG